MTVDLPGAEPGPEASDEVLLEAARSGHARPFEQLVRRYNQRLFSAVRSIVTSDQEAEDVVQHTYVKAYEHLEQFTGQAKFSTWLTRIAIHEALGRARRMRRFREAFRGAADAGWASGGEQQRSPEHEALQRELRTLLEAALDRLPESHRTVVVLRDVEGMSGADVAECLDLSEVAVRVQLHRARSRLKELLRAEIDPERSRPYAFAGGRCDRLTRRVMSLLERRFVETT
ncbi:MAG TPA: RNA polymerase sigma factor [Polyangiaceae bacterium]|nr:RNA polymerase sigma factor [Polyangiaceae bacterium]